MLTLVLGTSPSHTSRGEWLFWSLALDTRLTHFKPKTNLYVFSDIRYAEPPVGDLRFAAPIPPKGRSSPIKNGTGAPFCYQALPLWAGVTEYFQSSVDSGQPFNQTLVEEQLAIGGPGNLIQEPNMTEDCLFLDLYVPQAIFQKATTSKDRGERDFEAEDGDGSGGVPVLIWIHGGGFATGSKTSMGLYNLTTLIETSKIRGSDGIIFVAINYRVSLTVHGLRLKWLSDLYSWEHLAGFPARHSKPRAVSRMQDSTIND